MAKVAKKSKSAVSLPQRITGPRGLQSVEGFKDRAGLDSEWWGYYLLVAMETMQKYNFHLVYPSSIDYTALHARALGKDHPLLQGNIFSLLDPRDEHICLRPNFEVSFLRAYYQLHKTTLETEKIKPIENWYTLHSVYGDKMDPREKLQLFISVIGNDHPVVDAECTVAAYRFLQALGFTNIQVLINSIGDDQSQQAYKKELSTFYKDRKKDVCNICQPFVVRNPIQALACEREECSTLRQEAPQSVDWLTEGDKQHFVRVLEYLDELEVPYLLAPELIPFNEYDQKTVTALQVTTEEGVKYILAHGSRYDGLAQKLVDEDIPSMRMTIDLDRCLTAIRTLKMQIPEKRLPQVFFAQLGDEPKKKALSLREELHAAGIKTVEHFGRDSLKQQLEQATNLGVKITCILGQKELLDGTILIRDMDGGIQEEVPIDKLIPEIKKRLQNI